jgi:serine/threonine protein kinase
VDIQIGPYRTIREIGQDSTGQTFEAVDETNRKVVLKYLRPEAANPHTLARLQSEAKTLALLNHPHIARLFGFVRRDERTYLVMEFLEGKTLESILKEHGRFDPIVALGFFHQIISTVSYAHKLGVIHGNLGSSSILMTNAGMAKILDFPLMHILRGTGQAGSMPGTFRHMSPEQIKGYPADARSDIYGLGMLLYELVVGKGPFEYVESEKRLRTQLEPIPVPPSVIVPNIPKWIDGFVLRAIASSPADRFQSTNAMARAMKLPIKPTPATLPAKPKTGWRERSAAWISSATEPLFGAGKWCIESSKTMVSAIARVPDRTGQCLANVIRASAARMTLYGRGVASRVASLGRVFMLAVDRLFESSRRSLVQSFRINWKRYASTMCLVILVSFELFYFHGANITLLLDSEFLSRPSLTDVVDSMFARLDQGAPVTNQTKIDTNQLQPAIEEKEAPRNSLITEARRAAIVPAHNVRPRLGPLERRLASRRDRVDSFALRPEKQTSLPVLDRSIKETNLNEPVSRTAQNNTRKTQLNVQWEN